jgi:hypothetical protein
MKRINGMSGVGVAEGVRVDNCLSLAESVRVETSTIVASRIDPKTRAHIEVKLFSVGYLQEFAFLLIDHVPSRD